jgi:hypothetical protein
MYVQYTVHEQTTCLVDDALFIYPTSVVGHAWRIMG